MRDYNRTQRWQRNLAPGMPVTGLMPGAVPAHIVEWGPGVNVTLRGIAYAGDDGSEGEPRDHGRSPHKLHEPGRP